MTKNLFASIFTTIIAEKINAIGIKRVTKAKLANPNDEKFWKTARNFVSDYFRP